ncbi:MAG: ImmA/IrrE family metallo-endopeptidase [Candidatus Omnitrophota bacterium]
MVEVNPDILVWARKEAGLSLEEASKAIALGDARGRTGPERLAAFESGAEKPSRHHLLEMSKKYRRPLLLFYMEVPPRKGNRGQDFRILPQSHSKGDEALLDALIRDLKVRQNLVKELLEDEEAHPLPYIGSASRDWSVRQLAQNIKDTIGFQLNEFRSLNTIDDAFAYLRNRVENCGVFVLLAGDLGSYHSVISIETFRGFAIADPIAPFVIINSQDAKSAFSFTLFHEMAHLWLGETGVSGVYGEGDIERYCNDVASEILLPIQEAKQLNKIASLRLENVLHQISSFAKERKLSRSMIAYKLFRLGLMEEKRWHEIDNQLRNEWLKIKEIKKEKNQQKEGGPSYYVIRRYRLGPSLLNLVSRSIDEDMLTPTKAAKVLGVKPRNVEPLLRDIAGRKDN